MAKQATGLMIGSVSGLHVVASEQDRQRAFRAARRHTGFVRSFRMLLPVLAVLLLGAYGVPLVGTTMLRHEGIEVASVRIDTKNLVMETPSYDGYGKDGSRYQVRAREAITGLRQKGPVRLNAIDGTITQTTGAVTKLTSTWGTYDQASDILELHEKIDIDGSSGLQARLTRATVHAKESRVTSDEPVWARNETGTITAEAMTLDTKTRRATFSRNVQVHMEANSGRSGSTSIVAPRAPAASIPGLAASSDQPIDVRSQSLTVDDVAKTALFRENVVARQGEALLEAPELDVIYAGTATLTPATDKSTPATKLDTIRARGGVTTRSKDDKATSDTLEYRAASERASLRGNVVITSGSERRITAHTADFDQKADTALLTGDVVAIQGRNVLKGRRLFVDRKQGHTRLDSPASENLPSGRISTRFYRTDQPGTAGARRPALSPGAKGDSTTPLALDFKTDPEAPIDVEADTLDVFDPKHTATFRNNVIAKQGDFVVRAVEMVAHYTGQTGLGSASTGTNVSKAESGGAQLTRIEAREKVLVTSKDGREVIGDRADFDVKANNIVVGGKVVVSDGRSSIDGPEGSRLVIDLASGRSHFEDVSSGRPTAAGRSQVSTSSAAPASSSASGAAVAGKSSTLPCPEGTVCTKRQYRLILYPKQVEAKAKDQIEKVKRDGTSPAAAVVKEIERETRARRTKPATSAWEATTSGTPQGPAP